MKKILFTALILWFITLAGKLHSQQIPDNTTGRLWGLCKVWGYMKYYHPNTCQVNWDSLIRENCTLVAAASDNIQYNTYVMNMLDYLGQITPQQATTPPLTDSNLNLQLDWISPSNFSQPVEDFLNVFKSRAGTNAALACRVRLNDFSDQTYNSRLNFDDDAPGFIPNFTLLKDRLSCAFAYWNVFNYFGPYRNLTDQSWDTTLMHVIDDMMAATNGLSYTLAMAKMQARTDDAHGFFYSTTYYNFLGYGAVGIQLRWYEQKMVVYKTHENQTGLTIGDELVAVDGIPIADVAAIYRDRIAASNEATFHRDLGTYLCQAPVNTSKVLQFRNNAGQLYTVQVSYNMSLSDFDTWRNAPRSGPSWSTACNGYGYVDMAKLQPSECEQMYQELKAKPGIIFDCRNYPNGTLVELAKFFFAEPIITTRFFSQNLQAPGLFKANDDGQNLGSWNNPSPYTGQLYFIVDQKTQSQAEYTVQYLSHAPNATVIGTQTAGADGNISYVRYPDVNNIYFTSLGWYYEDWYQCQRNGIKINNIVTPTIQGLRDGKDEMLESITGCVTSIKESVATIEQLELMPNPARAQITIRFNAITNATMHFTVSDIFGRIKLSKEQKAEAGKNNCQIPVNELAPGVYFLKISAGAGSSRTLKFIKE